MGSCSMKINDLLRVSGVKRWHIVRTSRDQSLADHTFDVIVLARAIAKELNMDDVEIMKAAFLHDLDEVVTGDIPSPMKRRAREQGVELNNIYRAHTGRELTDREAAVVKCADLMADIIWLDSHWVGGHAKVVFDGIRKSYYDFIRDKNWLQKAADHVFEQAFSRDFEI